MSMSIYYVATRGYELSKDEKNIVNSIVSKYSSNFPLKIDHEDFCLYNEPFDEPNVVLNGATSIPMNTDYFYDIILYWLNCLTELTRRLPDCRWSVNLDDVDLIWEAEEGWRLPTDEEMKN